MDTLTLDPALKARMEESNSALMRVLLPKLGGLFQSEGFPPLLCHYTDFAGLKGILETGRLWATYARALNDSTEQQYGLDAVTEYLRHQIHQLPSELQRAVELGGHNPRRNFVSCYCESSQVLSMWRSYASFGSGFCLEFEGPALLGCSFPPHSVRLPFKMTYGNDLPKPLSALLDTVCAFAQRGFHDALMAGSWLSILALKFKHAAFVEEREWRLIIQDPEISSIQFRSGHSDVKPYIELCPVMADGSKRLPLKRIVFGPTLRNDGTLAEVLALMLERYGYSGIPAEPSGLPYRL